MMRRPLSIALLCATAVAVLAGCSTGPRLVEGQVQSFSTLQAIPSPATYRIERLPSQQMPSFEPIVALAEQALGRAGLRRDDAAPRLLAQVGVQADTVPRYDPFRPYGAYGPYPWGMGGWYGRGWGFHGGWGFNEPTPLHRRAVSIVLRDAATQAVVYETSAVHEDVWVSDPAVYGVLFDAALTGFPQPPQGPRVVRQPLAPIPPAAPGTVR
ncbi:DUF4136 domain-containing protein [Acidovorax sp. sic0104]|uniref:DUF4136 domain-containing protein n=1 Tax=Acidovorax sp. sic0104 TaxID=2854784 RepID=UPI001C484713|nr:DUF4136 domain-containing protein [Acidovorax sp. sic0104]MBV7542259.1 DUF4136 domain-containing protein [Acidovorax sp. sic0104]